jgi:subtilisin family serine protease
MISYALDHGVVIVAAAGDQATVVGPPANSRGVVAVSAVDVDAKPASKANGGDSLVVMAPGVDVSSGSVDALGHWSSAGVQSGSSASTALVAAGLALVKARYPTATGNQLIQDLIHNTGGDHPFGHTSQFGFGIMSLSRMLAADPTGLPNVNPLRAEGPAAVDPAAALPSAAGSSAPAVATRTSRHSRLPWVAFGVLALALAAAVLIIIALRRRRPAALSPEQPSLVSAGSKEN